VQLALPHLLAGRHPWQTRVRERIARNLATLDTSAAAEPQVDLLTGAGGWVGVLQVPRRRSEEEWAHELLRRGVVVHPGQFYDFEDEAFLVVSLIVEPEVFAAGLREVTTLAGEG